ncbi:MULTISPECIES: hypothetical protein [unclassified Frigoribacterium]|uniref:hypothetical protein n=1 Tax=unclassified Frigoribacterium TaxID=2627005 RepID=UPI000F9E3C40|nr:MULTISPECIES: hypothetical protein [unclassified Frigoribacterium]ROP78672.1 hypothetical protein EDF18_1328 [Frigoribacterium sp. PhB107]TDT66465.1 hypothetical protein EDF20_1280 [Frigoribacterium sp. PhB116]
MRTRTVILGGPLLVALYAGIMVVSLGWLEPQAAVPGLTRTEIAQGLDHFGSDLTALTWSLVVLGLVGVGLSAVASTVGRRARLQLSTIATLHLGLLVLGAPVSFFAAFPLGMDMADAFGVSGGLRTPWYMVLLWASGISLLSLLALLFSTIRTGQPITPSQESGAERRAATIHHH